MRVENTYLNICVVQYIYSITHMFIYLKPVWILMNSDADFQDLTDEEIEEEKKFQRVLDAATE